jgi:hypothetical protein
VFGRSQIQEEIAREFGGVPGLKLKLAGWAARSSPGIGRGPARNMIDGHVAQTHMGMDLFTKSKTTYRYLPYLPHQPYIPYLPYIHTLPTIYPIYPTYQTYPTYPTYPTYHIEETI